MQSVSDEFLAAIRGPHRIAVKAVVTSADGTTSVEVPIEDGAVTIDRTAEHRRQLDLTVSDPTLYPDSVASTISVDGAEVQVWRGVAFSDGSEELVSLGVFRIQDATRQTPGGGLQITGWDRSVQVSDQRFTHPVKYAAQDGTALIESLISAVYPDAVFHDSTGDTTNIPKHVVDRDRWAEAVRVANVIGAEVYPDANGEWVIAPVPDIGTATPVWSVDAGPGGVLVQATDMVTRDGVPSVVVALGESTGGGTAVHSVVPHGYDNDPLSPTYYLGAYGKVPRFYSSPHIKTLAQANKVADAQLADHKGVTRSIDLSFVPNPALEAGDCILVTRPDGTQELHLIDTLVIPLSPAQPMTGSTRAQNWNAE